MRERAERLGLSVIEERRSEPVEDAVRRVGRDRAERRPTRPPARRGRESSRVGGRDAPAEGALERRPSARPNGRRTKVITGRPDGAPRPLSLVPAERRRPPRTPAEWIGPRPERIVAWAFALGLLLILIAISTAERALDRGPASPR